MRTNGAAAGEPSTTRRGDTTQDAPAPNGHRPAADVRRGSELWSPSGRRWTVTAFHPRGRVELVHERHDGVVAMIVDRAATARMVPAA